MLKLYNTFGRKIAPFRLPHDRVATIFTCGPSVYQRAHIGNFRTFLFEDILVRYLEYSGYRVKRGMAVTDVEDKSIREAEKRKTSLKELTDRNISGFIREMRLLKMKNPDYLPRASECVAESVKIIKKLIEKKIAYRHGGNIYFEPLRFPGFGMLFGLDMACWPKKKRRFHKDTYPGIQWNYGDFILWHGCTISDKACWDTELGEGRPSWNVQDPSMVMKYFKDTLSVFCGGIDNLYRHHDYSLAILESVRPYPMARFWMHGAHLFVNGQKMSKSKGNILYTDMLMKKGYTAQEVRFFLMYGHYRRRLNYSDRSMQAAVTKLRSFNKLVAEIGKRAGAASPTVSRISLELRKVFTEHMDNDLDVKNAYDALWMVLNKVELASLTSTHAAGIIRTIKRVDETFKVFF